ncbi:MAG: hypothetical protein H5U37_06275, partial [Caldisericia bacterium]|nr:hypothetical protein [Caldisericia bacterium]
MDYEKIVVNLEFIYLLVFIKENKIFKTEILLSGFENFEKKHKEIIDEI